MTLTVSMSTYFESAYKKTAKSPKSVRWFHEALLSCVQYHLCHSEAPHELDMQQSYLLGERQGGLVATTCQVTTVCGMGACG
eukprot:6261336-Amphidinium_carterae.1